MSDKSKANAIDAEGKLESAYGELTGDLGHQIKGKAKQVQASAMNATDNLKEGAKVIKEKIRDAASQVADDLS
jgi:uncharacterized protein YjbJ (UPF0337 family)